MAKLGYEISGFGQGKNWEERRANDDELFQRICARSRQVDPEGSLTGALIRFPVADGYAHYEVEHLGNSVILHHLKMGDAYEASAPTIRGLTVADVRRMLATDRAFEALHKKSASFYDGLKVGQILHYVHMRGKFIRCRVAEGKNKDGVQGKILVPIAMVGDWSKFDLPRRLPSGDIELGYHAKSIVEAEQGKVSGWQPSESCIYETQRAYQSGIDPRKLDPLDLSVPEATAEEAKINQAVKALENIRAITVNENTKEALDTALARVIDMATLARARLN